MIRQSFRRAAAGLAIFCSASLLPAQSDSPVLLTPAEAARRALAENLGLLSSRYSLPIAEEAKAAAEADQRATTVSAEVSAGYLESATTPTDPRVRPGPRSQDVTVSVAISRELDYGGRVSVSAAATGSETNGAIGPDRTQDTSVTVGYVHPLLQGAGKRVNLAAIARAEAGAEAERLRLKAAILDVVENTETAYWNTSYSAARSDLQRSSVEVAEQLLREASERERLGLATPIDVLQARSNLAARREVLLRSQQDAAAAADALFVQLGGLPEAAPSIELPTVAPLPQEAVAVGEWDALWAAVLANDFDSAAQEQAIRQLEIDQTLSRDRLRPRLDVTVSATLSGRGTGLDGALDRTAQADGRNFSAGIAYSQALGQRAERARLRQSQYQVEREQWRLAQIKQGLQVDARSTYRDLVTGAERLAAANTALELATQTFAQTRARYNHGLAPFSDVLEAQSQLDSARASRLDAAINVVRADVRRARLDGSLLARHNLVWDEAEPLFQAPNAP